jgi:hypothetical protein
MSFLPLDVFICGFEIHVADCFTLTLKYAHFCAFISKNIAHATAIKV